MSVAASTVLACAVSAITLVVSKAKRGATIALRRIVRQALQARECPGWEGGGVIPKVELLVHPMKSPLTGKYLIGWLPDQGSNLGPAD